MSDQKSQGSRGQQDQRSLALWVTMEKAAYWTRRWERVPSVLSGERALTVMVVNPQGGVITSILWTQVLPDDFHLGNLYSKGQEEVKEVRDKVAYNEGKMESVSLYLVSRSINLFFFCGESLDLHRFVWCAAGVHFSGSYLRLHTRIAWIIRPRPRQSASL